ncbi:MAG TPA: diguanylate cyclase, partial [Chromatiaceae bacterium]|nr:diguanylate cyclase [Chromatiaceae bacterium]
SFPTVDKLTVSCGVAELRPQDTFHTWLERADHALYAAKAAGRDQVMADVDDQPPDPEPAVSGAEARRRQA